MAIAKLKKEIKKKVNANSESKNTEKLKLITGSFTSQEAKEILTNMFGTKINYHQLKNFSSIERTGKPDALTLKRMSELQKEVEKLNLVLRKAEKAKQRISINSSVVLKLIK